MPIYEEECRACGLKQEYLSSVTNETRPCRECGGLTDRLYSLAALAVFEGFDTRNIHPDGKNIHIGRKGDLTRMCHEFGVVPGDNVMPPSTRFQKIEREVPKF